MKTLKYSRQREAIKDYLILHKNHPTADTVYHYIRGEFPNISLGTVYRNLSLLAERGEILKLSCGDGADHFDARTAPHHHFYCRLCHRVSDLELPDIEDMDFHASRYFDGQIEGHSLYFYGICRNCSKIRG